MQNNEAFWEAWEEKTISSVDEAQKLLDSFHLVGRKVKRMRFVGMCYDLTEYNIEDYAYNALDKSMDEVERQTKSDFDNIDNEFKLERLAEIDEPLLIEFEDGDRLELSATWKHYYILTMNHIPWNIEANVNLPNIDANVLFSPLLNQTITGFEIVPNEVATTVVCEIILWFDNGLGLKFYDYIDYGHFILTNRDDEYLYIPFGELKKGIIGR